ncbi:hypothetical protein TPA0598_01_00480 [Streptomyces lydicamycinicus]|uniref:Uncharacterized protein n=1 Tax=Streptomyces lydicamycinicus TaxID=1546107 RepID=A0A0P4QZ73_9ACTN|nr:hypothetical protein TPA0598_01_00480 [Streptomyces lydicamycinicus]
MATKAPSRLIKVLVHSHQNCRGRPETLSTAARRKPDRLVGPGVDADMTFPPSNGEAVRGRAAGGSGRGGRRKAGRRARKRRLV